MQVRDETPADMAAVHALNVAAFGSPAEADLVDALRARAQPLVSLVALNGETVVGHIMFSPVRLVGHEDLKLMGLAPMAVAPVHQRRGVGARLVQAGLARCRELHQGAVVVLGHAGYYPRFGFQPASRFGITSTYEAPDEAFMVVELASGCLRGMHGVVHFHEAFDAL